MSRSLFYHDNNDESFKTFMITLGDLPNDLKWHMARTCGYKSLFELSDAMACGCGPFFFRIEVPIKETKEEMVATAPVMEEEAKTDPEMPDLEQDTDTQSECDSYVDSEDHPDHFDKDLRGFNIYPYGKGYQLIPPRNHPDIGEEYYLNGWWNKNIGGWFFRKEFVKPLIDMGAHMNH